MSNFATDESTVEVIFNDTLNDILGGSKNHFILTKTIVYYIDGKSDQYVIVPTGYITDMATIPRPFKPFFDPWGKYAKAAIIHDWLCEHRYYSTPNGRVPVDRKFCDKAFLNLMTHLGVPKAQRQTMYTAVRTYGMTIGNKHKPERYAKKQHFQKAIETRLYEMQGSFEKNDGSTITLDQAILNAKSAWNG